MHLAGLVAHEPLEAPVRTLQLLQERAHGGGTHLDPIAIRGRAPEWRRNVDGRHYNWGPRNGPQTPKRSGRPGEAVAPLDLTPDTRTDMAFFLRESSD